MTSKKIYVAAPYAARRTALFIASQIIQSGHVVTSSWLHGTREIHEGTVGACPSASDEVVSKHTAADFSDVRRADILLGLTGAFIKDVSPLPIKDEWLHTGGRHVEFGYAVALGKEVHILGDPENVFYRAYAKHHPGLSWFLGSLTS